MRRIEWPAVGCTSPGCKPRELVTGETTCSCSEAWRHECEAATILRMPSLEARRLHLSRIGDGKRGKAVRNALEDTMMALHKRAKVQAKAAADAKAREIESRYSTPSFQAQGSLL